MHNLVAATATAFIIVIGATPAWAHVTISPTSVPEGARETVEVHVPNEIDGARTVRVELDAPAAPTPLDIQAPTIPGWTTSEHVRDGEVSQVLWAATVGGGIGAGQAADFPLTLRAPPTSGLLVFKALQTYDNGTVVRWIEPPGPDGSPAPNPYPTLLVTGQAPAPPPSVRVARVHHPSGRTPLIVGLAGLALFAAGAAFALGRHRTHDPGAHDPGADAAR